MAQWTIRLPDDLAKAVEETAKDRGFASPRAFIRDAIRKELRSRAEDADSVEARLAATLERLTREVRKLQAEQQAHFALTDGLAKAFLVCVAEPPAEAIEQARSRAKLRHDRLMRSVAASITGGAQ